jgi:short subunit dehydrogenase-like uncharacterized protein
MTKQPRYDLIVFGATSFVGGILCRHLVRRHGTDGELRWAIAGRSETKLDEVAAATGAAVDKLVADALSVSDMDDLAARAKVVVSTVGPYAKYGSELVRACAQAGTDYCDLTGEPQWMQAMIDAHQDTAVESGARIVHACGFDSIPSDMGVWFVQREAAERLGRPCQSIAMRVAGLRGGASGGTIASMTNVLDELRSDPSLRKVLGNPYALAPDGMRTGVRQPNVTLPTNDGPSGQWVAPFVMAQVNTRIVQRSHALLGRPWGEGFTYDEAMLMGGGPAGAAKAAAVATGLGGFAAAMAAPPIRSVLNRFLPQPGEGPSPEQQESGYFRLRFYGSAGSDRIEAVVSGQGDPGYGSTGKMLGEAAATLVDTSGPGGFWTPSTAAPDDLFRALVDHADLSFEIVDPA